MAIICPKLTDSIFMSWSTQKSLGVLPKSWPWELHARACPVALRKLSHTPTPDRIPALEWPPAHFPNRLKEVCREFSDILVEELKQGEKIHFPIINVCMRPGK